jgi:hypothetical protein
MEISYYADYDSDYVTAVKTCNTQGELKEIIEKYREFAEDAYTIVKDMGNEEFEAFRKGRRKKDPGLKWMETYGAVLLPEKLFKI